MYHRSIYTSMITSKAITETLNSVAKPATVTQASWEIAKRKALGVWEAKAKGLEVKQPVVLHHSGELELYVDVHGTFAIGDLDLFKLKANADEDSEELVRWMQELYLAEAYLDAALLAHRLWLLNPEVARLAREATACYLKANLPMIALFLVRKAIEAFPSHGELYLLRSDIYLHLGWLELSLADADTASRFNPYSATVLVKKAKVLYNMGSYGTAIRCLKLAMEFRKDFHPYYELLAMWQYEVRSYADAARTAARAYALNPTKAQTLYLMAITQDAVHSPKALVNMYLEAAQQAGSKEALAYVKRAREARYNQAA